MGRRTLSKAARFAKGVTAGVEQFGGVDDPAPLLTAVKSGAVSVAAIDAAVARILKPEFEMGLFENPYVDAEAAVAIVGAPES